MNASWQKYGIQPQLVERVKLKMKNPVIKDRIKALLDGVTKYDLQDRAKVRQLVKTAARILNEPLTDIQEEQLVAFVLAQKIDPNNTLHLIKLWAMFR
ncbi:serine/threonine protein kinase [Cohnella sp. CFH 77786]|uniref:stage VI sporulation protein F n=1 Tax=Cohnella sp. CFH 77786 TaxID=2662265 RepID=UPI001C60C237|nr:stage VI sporulation protein F [Cohnella sp. CFH 77786]MBW5444650.1 serine/threonine protein kinase [Cohnella sp. CFH 77786]